MAYCPPCDCYKSETNWGAILGVGFFVGFLVWIMSRPAQVGATQSVPAYSPGTYTNEERWNVTYNEAGMPSEVVVHRQAERG